MPMTQIQSTSNESDLGHLQWLGSSQPKISQIWDTSIDSDSARPWLETPPSNSSLHLKMYPLFYLLTFPKKSLARTFTRTLYTIPKSFTLFGQPMVKLLNLGLQDSSPLSKPKAGLLRSLAFDGSIKNFRIKIISVEIVNCDFDFRADGHFAFGQKFWSWIARTSTVTCGPSLVMDKLQQNFWHKQIPHSILVIRHQ